MEKDDHNPENQKRLYFLNDKNMNIFNSVQNFNSKEIEDLLISKQNTISFVFSTKTGNICKSNFTLINK